MKLINNNTDLNKRFIGKILNIDTNTRECYVHIPEVMPTLSSSSMVNNTTPLNRGKVKNVNNLNLNTNITTVNVFKLKAQDKRDKMPVIGSKVWVRFIDGNIKQGIWSEFNVDGSLEYISSEKYDKLYSLNIGNKFIDVKEDDNINIEIPDTFEVLYIEDVETKTKTFKIVDNSNYSIQDLLDEIKNMSNKMDYLSGNYKNGVLNDLDGLYNIIDLSNEVIESYLKSTVKKSISLVNKLNDIGDIGNEYTLITKKINIANSITEKIETLQSLYEDNKELINTLQLLTPLYYIIREVENTISSLFDMDKIIEILAYETKYDKILSTNKNIRILNPGNNFDVVSEVNGELFSNLEYPSKEDIYVNLNISDIDDSNMSTLAIFGFYIDEGCNTPTVSKYIECDQDIFIGFCYGELSITSNYQTSEDTKDYPSKLYIIPSIISNINNITKDNVVIKISDEEVDVTYENKYYVVDISGLTISDGDILTLSMDVLNNNERNAKYKEIEMNVILTVK